MDYFKFTAAVGSLVTAVTSQPMGGVAMDPVVTIFDSNGAALATNDNFTGLHSRLHYTIETAGDYFVAVSGDSGSVGDYRLDLTMQLLNSTDFELGTLLSANSDGSDGFVINGIFERGYLGSPRLFSSSTG